MSAVRACLIVVVGCAVTLTAAWAQLPPEAEIGHGGVRAELSVPNAEGGVWRVRAYRPRRSSGSPLGIPRGIPGAIDLCMAVDQGGRRWSGIVCSLTAAIGLRIERRGLWPECGGVSSIVGEPVPPGPLCGVVGPDVVGVTVTAEGHGTQSATLSEPFEIRVNRSARVLKRSGIDPERGRSLPAALSLRAFLGFVNTPPTKPGKRTPRVTITATRADGASVSHTTGGHVVPTRLQMPSLQPPRGAKRTRISTTGPDGRRWTTVGWRDRGGGLCANLKVGKFPTSTGCHGSLQLIDQFARRGAMPYVDHGPHSSEGFAVYGSVRGDAQALTIVDPRGRAWAAELSPVWTNVRRRTGNHLKRFRSLPRSMSARTFLAVLAGSPPRRGGLELRTTLADGRVLTATP